MVEFSRAITQSEEPPGSGNSLPRFCMTATWSLFRIRIGECYTMKCMYHVPCRDPVRLTGWGRGDKKIGAARLSCTCRRKDSTGGVQSGKGNSVASLCSLEPGHSVRLRSDSTHQSFPPKYYGGSATQFLGTSRTSTYGMLGHTGSCS